MITVLAIHLLKVAVRAFILMYSPLSMYVKMLASLIMLQGLRKPVSSSILPSPPFAIPARPMPAALCSPPHAHSDVQEGGPQPLCGCIEIPHSGQHHLRIQMLCEALVETRLYRLGAAEKVGIAGVSLGGRSAGFRTRHSRTWTDRPIRTSCISKLGEVNEVGTISGRQWAVMPVSIFHY